MTNCGLPVARPDLARVELVPEVTVGIEFFVVVLPEVTVAALIGSLPEEVVLGVVAGEEVTEPEEPVRAYSEPEADEEAPPAPEEEALPRPNWPSACISRFLECRLGLLADRLLSNHDGRPGTDLERRR